MLEMQEETPIKREQYKLDSLENTECVFLSIKRGRALLLFMLYSGM